MTKKFYSVRAKVESTFTDDGLVFFTEMTFVRDYLKANFGDDATMYLATYDRYGQARCSVCCSYKNLDDITDEDLIKSVYILGEFKTENCMYDRLSFIIEEHQFED